MKDYNSMSLVEIATDIQSEATERTTFNDLYKKVAEAKGLDEEQIKKNMAQFYTDITASGDFVYCGDDLWDLKKNQPLSALDSEFYQEHGDIEGDDEPAEVKKPKKKAKKAVNKEGIEIVDLEAREEEENNSDFTTEEDGDAYGSGYEDYDPNADSDYADQYEADFDSELDDDDLDDSDDSDDEFDEDKYNSIMDDYEDQYDV